MRSLFFHMVAQAMLATPADHQGHWSSDPPLSEMEREAERNRFNAYEGYYTPADKERIVRAQEKQARKAAKRAENKAKSHK
jgi:hypothetical protein